MISTGKDIKKSPYKEGLFFITDKYYIVLLHFTSVVTPKRVTELL